MSDEVMDETGTAVQPEIDSIWLTRTSVKPFWLAVTLTLSLLGLFSFWPLLVAAGVASIAIAISWLGDSHVETDELPRS